MDTCSQSPPYKSQRSGAKHYTSHSQDVHPCTRQSRPQATDPCTRQTFHPVTKFYIKQLHNPIRRYACDSSDSSDSSVSSDSSSDDSSDGECGRRSGGVWTKYIPSQKVMFVVGEHGEIPHVPPYSRINQSEESSSLSSTPPSRTPQSSVVGRNLPTEPVPTAVQAPAESVAIAHPPQGASVQISGRMPASKAFVERFERFEFSSKSPSEDCSICASGLEQGEFCARLACQHTFHSMCISKWFGRSNQCPLCRYEVETDDPAYEVDRLRRMDEKYPNVNPLTSVDECNVTEGCNVTNPTTTDAFQALQEEPNDILPFTRESSDDGNVGGGVELVECDTSQDKDDSLSPFELTLVAELATHMQSNPNFLKRLLKLVGDPEEMPKTCDELWRKQR